MPQRRARRLSTDDDANTMHARPRRPRPLERAPAWHTTAMDAATTEGTDDRVAAPSVVSARACAPRGRAAARRAAARVMATLLAVAAGACLSATAAGCQRQPAGGEHGAGAPAAASALLDLNHASQAELERLPEIGPAYARAIIAGRPYANKTQLRSRGVLPQRAYDAIVDRVIARQRAAEAR
jgi:competence protein ComEA